MLRILKTVVALTTIFALAACSSVTAPGTDEQAQSVTTAKQEIAFPEDGGGSANQPATGTEDDESVDKRSTNRRIAKQEVVFPEDGSGSGSQPSTPEVEDDAEKDNGGRNQRRN